MTTSASRALHVVGVAVVLAATLAVGAGCAECVDGADCPLVEVCTDGACVSAPPAGLALVAPTDVVDGRFDLVVDATFDGDQATLTVARDGADPGEPCLPFLERSVVVDGTGARSQRRVTFADLPPLGASFSLRVTLVSPGALPVERSFAIRGPAVSDGIGGAQIIGPGGDVDVDVTPLVPLLVTAEGPAVAWVEPDDAPALPRFVIATGPGDVAASVVLVRGPQVVWVETTTSSGTSRCGRAVRGLPAGDDGGALDLTLVARAADPAWVQLSLRIARGDDVDVCSIDDDDDGFCRAGRPPAGPGEITFEQLQLRLDDGVVDVGVVPRVSVGPVTGLVRITQAGRHRGFFGPFTFLPDDGESWVAGQVVVAGGTVAGVRSVDGVVRGAPW
jgi:hypothetical protein